MQYKKALFLILVDALCGMFNTRVRGGCRRARSPHANELCEQSHASKADATKVARMSGGRAKAGYAVERPPRQAVRRSRLTTGKAGLAVAPQSKRRIPPREEPNDPQQSREGS